MRANQRAQASLLADEPLEEGRAIYYHRSTAIAADPQGTAAAAAAAIHTALLRLGQDLAARAKSHIDTNTDRHKCRCLDLSSETCEWSSLSANTKQTFAERETERLLSLKRCKSHCRPQNRTKSADAMQMQTFGTVQLMRDTSQIVT